MTTGTKLSGSASSSGLHHTRKSNAADGEKDQQITMRINRTGGENRDAEHGVGFRLSARF